MNLNEQFQQHHIGLTVYSPDCTHSRLWGNLDYEIATMTGLTPVYRQWVNHDYNSIMRFYSGEAFEEKDPQEAVWKYATVSPEIMQYGHLVTYMFITGPSLLTLWHGENAAEKLPQVKGSTHPSEAAGNTIRGRFWCDNAVTNLMHVSDDEAEIQRELSAIGFNMDRDIIPLPLMQPEAHIIPKHSGIFTVYDVLKRQGANLPDYTLPASGSAQETNQQLTAILKAASTPFTEAFFAGDMVTVTQLMQHLPVTPWERFVIQCGTITRYKWNLEAL